MKRKDLTGQIFNSWTVGNYECSKNNRKYWLCTCECGTKKIRNSLELLRGAKSCGCKHSLIGKTFHYLKVVNFTNKIKYGQHIWRCLCKCGNYIDVATASLNSKNTKSCGCFNKESIINRCRKNIVGEVFGKLTVLEYSHTIGKIAYWKCKCDCDNITYVGGTTLRSNHTNSCGNCNLYRNGVTTSFKALELHKMLNKGIHNFKTKLGFYVDIALVINNKKIAIEYMEHFWHFAKQIQDEQRIKKLIANNWKVIQIKASNNLPTKEELMNAISLIINENKDFYEIKLNGWGTGRCFNKEKKCLEIF